MKQFIPAITLITLLSLQMPVQATWSSKRKPLSKEEEKAQTKTPGFNLHDNRSGLFELDYLFWKPQMEDCHFGLKTTETTDAAGTTTAKARLKQPSFELSSGVRLGFGGYSSDSWDISARGTYLFSDASKHTNANPSNGVVSVPNWYGSIFGLNGISAHDRWQMNFALLDLSIGREFFLTKRFAVHPFIGLRGAIINQKDLVKYSALYTLTQLVGTLQVMGDTKFRAKSNIAGVGPRAGFDLNFYVARDWAFLGGLAGSLLYTHYSTTEKFFGFQVSSGTPQVLNQFNLKVKDSSNFGRANLDAYIGFGWNHWFDNGKKRLAVALAFEAQQWFNLNQWFALDLTSNAGALPTTNNPLNIRADKKHGDLSLVGGTVHFQFDF
jgi:hypothetical protein